jgi:hypothetical protein
VPFMQGAHGRYKSDFPARHSSATRGTANFLHSSADFHAETGMRIQDEGTH